MENYNCYIKNDLKTKCKINASDHRNAAIDFVKTLIFENVDQLFDDHIVVVEKPKSNITVQIVVKTELKLLFNAELITP